MSDRNVVSDELSPSFGTDTSHTLMLSKADDDSSLARAQLQRNVFDEILWPLIALRGI